MGADEQQRVEIPVDKNNMEGGSVGTKINLIDEKRRPLMKMRVSVGNASQLALLDSGATVSLIHESLVAQLGEDIDHSKLTKLTVIGSRDGCEAIGTIVLPVKVGNIKWGSVEFVVVPKETTMENDFIIGMDAIRRCKLKINPHDRTVTKMLNDNASYTWNVKATGRVETTSISHIPCYAAANISLTGSKCVKIPLKFDRVSLGKDEMSSLLFVDNVGCHEGHTVLPGIVDKNSLHVLISAVNGNSIEIKKGDLIAEVSTVVEIDQEDSKNEKWTDEEIDNKIVLEHMPNEQKNMVKDLLIRYQHVLSQNEADLGKASVQPHKIVLYDETPVYQRPRRFPDPVNKAIEDECKKLLDMDVIEYSTSPWSSPIVPITKKSGEIRMCVDYRKLNEQTKPDRSPVPNLPDTIYGLHGMKYFSTLDLVRGYYQIPLDDSSKEVTAFSTARAHYQFKRLSFGLRNAPAAFQRLIQEVLRELPRKKVVVFIDDILIMSSSFEEHLELVGRVLETLGSHGIKIKPSKCQWFADEVDFLGHTVSCSGLKKQQVYVDKVLDFPEPSTVSQMREFLGLVNFQKKFVPGASVIQKPLAEWTKGKKSSKITWTEEMRDAFKKLKTLMAEDVELAFPSYAQDSEKLELYVDASAKGAGACLQQRQNGVMRTIAYASMTFNHAQRNYSTIERELAALRWGIKSLRSFLFGIEFVVKTDHQPLVHLHNMRLVDSRLARTLTELADFNFTIEYTPGRYNEAADGLSRMYAEKPGEVSEEATEELPAGLDLNGAPVAGGGDSMLISLLRCLLSAEVNHEIRSHLELRKILVEELLKAPEKYGFKKLDKNRRRELRLMQYAGQLPCLELLLVASYLFDVQIFVYFWSTQPIVYRDERIKEKEVKTVHLQCLAGIHFNALKVNDQYCPVVPINLVSGYRGSDEKGDEVELKEVGIHEVADQCTQCDPSDHPRIDVQIGEKQFCAILDLGAEVSLVRQSVVDKLSDETKENYEKTTIEAIGLTGDSGNIEGCIDLHIRLPAGMGDVKYTFGVVNDQLIPNCMLFGIDFMSDNRLSIDGVKGVCFQTSNKHIRRNKVLLSSAKGRSPSAAECQGSLEYHCVNPVTSLSEAIRSSQVMRKDKTTSKGTHQTTHESDSSESNAERNIGKSGERGYGSSDTSLVSSTLWEPSSLMQIQDEDSILRDVKAALEDEILLAQWPISSGKYRQFAASLAVIEGLLCFVDSKCNRAVPVVDRRVLAGMALQLHNEMSHLGRDKLLHLLRQHVWGLDLYSVVADVCTSCRQCQMNKCHRQERQPPTRKIVTSEPFELVAMDLVQFNQTPSGYMGCCVLVDHYSKWVSVIPIRNKRAESIIKAFESGILPNLLQIPKKVLTDNGPEFTSSDFENMLERYNISHVFSTPYKASSNGAVERVNRTLGELLRSMSQDSGWDSQLTRAVLTYNNTLHRELGMSPSAFLLAKSHEGQDRPIVSTEDRTCWKVGHPDYQPFKLGDLVIRKIPKIGNLAVNKLKAKYEGPFRVKEVNENGVTYKLISLEDQREIKAHHRQLVLWKEPPNYIKECPKYKEYLLLNEQVTSGAGYNESRRELRVNPPASYLISSESDEDSSFSDTSSYTDGDTSSCESEKQGSKTLEASGVEHLDEVENISNSERGVVLPRVNETWEISANDEDVLVSQATEPALGGTREVEEALGEIIGATNEVLGNMDSSNASSSFGGFTTEDIPAIPLVLRREHDTESRGDQQLTVTSSTPLREGLSSYRGPITRSRTVSHKE